jgi:non-specific serine/threonine protein kinase
LGGLARAVCPRGEYGRAARLFGAAEAFEETLGGGSAEWWADQTEDDRRVASARAGLGEAAFGAAWSEGRSMTLEQAVEYALASAGAVPGPIARKEPVTRDRAADPLTAREREVAAFVARGLTNRQIAEQLVIAERTAETHVQNIFNKLGFTSRAQVAAWAAEHGLRAT